jgi:isocitrate dehydrogenase kinase/phosphatase
MNKSTPGSQLARTGAEAIFESFDSFHNQFKAITLRAGNRFLNREWPGVQKDAAQRLGLYRNMIGEIEVEIRRLLEDALIDRSVWIAMKSVYSGLIRRRNDWEIAETYFNSVTRRIFFTVGVDPQIEFVNTEFDTPPTSTSNNVYRSYLPKNGSTDAAELLLRILKDCEFKVKIQNPDQWAAAAAEQILRHVETGNEFTPVERIDVAGSIFYRSKGAYLLGRIMTAKCQWPLAIALQHPKEGIEIDAVLLDEEGLSILFSFTRSYFLACTDRPYDLVRFLKSIMPHKRIAELYNAIGYNKHGKTELYRDIVHFTSECGSEQFTLSPGKPGLVMIVFNMAHDDLVIKLIRDRFRSPKTTTRNEVIEKYDLVFRHDRAGRLVEAHTFEHLKFDRCWFSDELLDELRKEAHETVVIQESDVIIRHAYVERRVTPLDMYLRTAGPESASVALVDYGNAIKDLAVSNIFPGDMLLKNFGVTRHGRVVFYDYDELCPLMGCNFRKIPPARFEEDELADEPWYLVGPNDVFPEEMARFLGLSPELFKILMQHHADLFGVAFWLKAQDAIRAGEIIHILPYPQNKRLIQTRPHIN